MACGEIETPNILPSRCSRRGLFPVPVLKHTPPGERGRRRCPEGPSRCSRRGLCQNRKIYRPYLKGYWLEETGLSTWRLSLKKLKSAITSTAALRSDSSVLGNATRALTQRHVFAHIRAHAGGTLSRPHHHGTSVSRKHDTADPSVRLSWARQGYLSAHLRPGCIKFRDRSVCPAVDSALTRP